MAEPSELLTMSAKEIDRVDVIRRVLRGALTQVKAAEILGIGARQVHRLLKAYEADGPAGLVSHRRGKPSNRQLSDEVRSTALDLIRERYADFGPTLAREKLDELHGIRLGKETLRRWMASAGIWLPRDKRLPRPQQPRQRRDCLGELVQIDGSDHAWFEDRGSRCTLLVFVDDATGRLMELRFVEVESAFDYFEATKSYLRRHGKPVAFYSDKHSIFRVTREGTSGPGRGVTQFGRALGELNVDIICANSPQAKGRVERMNRSLQDRLVKELRLRGISDMEAANRFAPVFVEDFNRRFARSAKNAHDAHRPLRADEDLERIFTWQEMRTMSRNLVVHYQRATYLIEPTDETRALAGSKRRVEVHERVDGTIDIRYEGRSLPYRVYEKQPLVAAGDIVEHKRLGAALAVVQQLQDERDAARLQSKKVSLRDKDRLRATRVAAGLAAEPTQAIRDRPLAPAVAEYLKTFMLDQKAKQKRVNAATNDRKRSRELVAALGRLPPTNDAESSMKKP